MDEITNAVRAMYEKYPYPAQGAPTLRIGSDARFLLSLGERSRPKGRPIRVLDAGCGRGAGVLGAATVQRDVEWLGVDLNRVALEEASAQARARGLTNAKFQTVDLMTLEGLTVPEGGFDVIISSGVLHHLSDPGLGLARLRDVLAPHGMISFMVYGREGREALYRTVRALDLIAPRTLPIEERLDRARALLRGGSLEAMAVGPFADAKQAPDVEIVDRYLHVQETSYNVRELFGLLDSAQMRFERWNEPEMWSAEALLPPELREHATRLSPLERFALVEAMTYKPMLDLVMCHAGNGPRARLGAREIGDARLAVSTEVSFIVESRCLRGDIRPEKVTVHRRRERLELSGAPFVAAALVLREQRASFRGAELVGELTRLGATKEDATSTVLELLRAEIIYSPHAADA